MSKYKIREFTAERLAEVRRQWAGLAGDDEFAIEMAGLFDWCATHIKKQDGDSQAWELYNQDSDRCDAIVEIVDSHHGSLSKLLKLFLTPELWDADDKREQIRALHLDAYTEVIRSGVHRGAKDVKLYGRTDLMLSILRSIHAHWPAEETGAQASFKGRWLTITLSD